MDNDKTYLIKYKNAKDETLIRWITIAASWDRNDITYYKAHCHEKNAIRIFRSDRIIHTKELTI